MIDRVDVLITGGGIIGLTIARELLKVGYDNIAILEKEKEIGKHASGRNSGVLHAGIYYSKASLKAQFCLQGNILMKEYCREKNIPLLETGKVIISRNKEEIPVLKELYQRALKNGAKAELIAETQLKTIEPYARTCELALFSPETAVVNPHKILVSIEKELIDSGKVRMLNGLEFMGINNNGEAITSNGNIYPVPDIRNPFLGIHFTKVTDGTVYIGPTAIPAFGRENYEFLKGVDKELFEILLREGVLFFTNAGFRKVAVSEPGKYFLRSFFKEIKGMVHDLNIEDILPSNKSGIRPQLVNWKKNELVMDFVVLKHEKSIHILNAISPAFTSSMAFAEFIVEKYIS